MARKTVEYIGSTPERVETPGDLWRLAPLALLLATALATFAVFLPASHVIRAIASVIVVIGPGCAIVPLLRLRDRTVAVLLVLLVSVSLLVCVAQTVTYVASFSWRPCAIALLAITGAGVAAQLLLSRRDRRADS
jgi:hypothetical protein